MATETKKNVSSCLLNVIPALCAVLVAITGCWLSSYVDLGGVDWSELKKASQQLGLNGRGKTGQLGARISWIASLFIYYTSFAIVMACSVKIMLKSLSKDRRGWNACIFSITLGAAIAGYFFFNFETISAGLIVDMMDEYLESSIDLLIAADICGTFGIVFLVAAACTVLLSEETITEKQTLHTTGQGKDLMLLLYAGSCFLVAGTFELKACMDYLMTHILPVDDFQKVSLLVDSISQAEFNKISSLHKAIKNVGDSTRVFSGSIYTALLIAMYLPAALIIETRVKALRPPDVADQDTFALSPAIKKLLNLVAAVAPLVVGTSLDVLTKITAL